MENEASRLICHTKDRLENVSNPFLVRLILFVRIGLRNVSNPLLVKHIEDYSRNDMQKMKHQDNYAVQRMGLRT